MAISLEDKLRTLPIERQERIKNSTNKLIRKGYALRVFEKLLKIVELSHGKIHADAIEK